MAGDRGWSLVFDVLCFPSPTHSLICQVWYAMILAEMGGDEKTVKPEDVAVFVERGEGM